MITTINEFKLILENDFQKDYLKWKRKNVTLRGISGERGSENNAGARFGRGLYSAALGNRTMAKGYGIVYFVVNAIPKNPVTFRDTNYAEIWIQNFKYKTLGYKNDREFNDATDLATELQKIGYDGIAIPGREFVHYKPVDVLYFENEQELKYYYESIMSTNESNNVLNDVEVATEEEFTDALLKLATLDLEDDQVRYPMVGGVKIETLFGGNEYWLNILNRTELPESGSFELSIENNDEDVIGFIRGTKLKNTLSFNLIHIMEDYRGKGIGTDIYEKFLEMGYTIKSDTEITDSTYSMYDRLQKQGYEPLIYKDGRVGLRKK